MHFAVLEKKTTDNDSVVFVYFPSSPSRPSSILQHCYLRIYEIFGPVKDMSSNDACPVEPSRTAAISGGCFVFLNL
jgi:hypothetical protein